MSKERVFLHSTTRPTYFTGFLCAITDSLFQQAAVVKTVTLAGELVQKVIRSEQVAHFKADPKK